MSLWLAISLLSAAPPPPIADLPSIDLGIAGGVTISGGGQVATIIASEHSSGTDHNGDGDTNDRIRFFVWGSAPRVLNTSLEASGAVGREDAGFFVFGVPELALGQDADGDGRFDDDVMHLLDSASGTISNLDMVAGWRPEGENLLWVIERRHQAVPLTKLLTSRGELLRTLDPSFSLVHRFETGWYLTIDERIAGIDLNHDGDLEDQVLHRAWYHDSGIDFGKLQRVRITLGRQRSPGVYEVSEDENGFDLNGDGDTSDFLIFAIHPRSGALINTNLEVAANRGGPIAEDRWLYLVDQDDQLRVFDLHSHESYVPGLRTTTSIYTQGPLVAGYVREPPAPARLAVFDAESGLVVDLGVGSSATTRLIVGNLGVVYVVRESVVGVDLNGDGDTLDSVVHTWDRATGAISNLGVAGTPHIADSHRIAIRAREGHNGVDWDDDGQLTSTIALLYDMRTGVLGNTASAFLTGAAWIEAGLVLGTPTYSPRLAFFPASRAAEEQPHLRPFLDRAPEIESDHDAALEP